MNDWTNLYMHFIVFNSDFFVFLPGHLHRGRADGSEGTENESY